MKKAIRAALCMSVILLTAARLGLCQEKKQGAFVEVKASPQHALLSQPVVISGQTAYHEKQHTVTIKIRHESGDPAKTLTENVSKEGAFTATFSETKKTGKYRVEVTSPDGKGKGETEFEVTLMSGLIDKVEHDLRQLDDRIAKLLRQAEEAVISLPASEERDEYIKRIDDLQEFQRTVNLPDVEILGELRRVVQGPTVVFLSDQEIFGKLQEWDEEAELTIEEIDGSKILDRSKESICETINTAMEGLKLAALGFKVGKDLLHTLANVLIDKTISALSKAVLGKTPEADAAAIGLKNAKAALHGKIGIAEAGPGLFAGALEPGVRWLLYNRYCGEYRCPIKVKMTMVWNEQAEPWMKYTIYLEGRMTLRFPLKSAPGQPLLMTGDIEGNAVKHEFWENVFLVEPLPKTIILLDRLWLSPPAFPNAVESPLDFGAIARTVTPASFNIPLIAEMTGDRIKMQFKPARVDFSAQMVHRKVFVVYTGLIPDFTIWTVPIQSAFWILSKGFGDPCFIDVQKDSSGKRFIAQTLKSHRETPNKAVVVDWEISFDSRKTYVKDLGGK